MAIRAAVLIDERDRRLGTTMVPETTFLIKHGEGIFVRTTQGLRLSGGAIGVVFQEMEPLVRQKLGVI